MASRRRGGHRPRGRGRLRPLPTAARTTWAARRQPLGWRAADARAGHGVPLPAAAAADRRALARAGSDHRRAAARDGPRDQCRRHDHRARRAVGQRRPDHRPPGVLPGEGRGAVRGADPGAARARRHRPLGVPLRCRRRHVRRQRGIGEDEGPGPRGRQASTTSSRCSQPRGSRRRSAASARWTAWTWRCGRGRCSASSGPTVRARPPSSTCCRVSSCRTPDGCCSVGSTSRGSPPTPAPEWASAAPSRTPGSSRP